MSPASVRRSRCGFTLLEVVVALTLTAVLLLSAHALLSEAADAAERASTRAIEADRRANAERLLRELADRAELPRAGGPRLRGDGRAARWSTWCDTPAGWMEQCEVTLAVLPLETRNVVALGLPDGVVLPVRSGFRTASLLYLRSVADGGSWVQVWGSALSLPPAIGVVVDGDTLIVRIGERG